MNFENMLCFTECWMTMRHSTTQTNMQQSIPLHGWKELGTQYVAYLMQTVILLYIILNVNGDNQHNS